MRDKKKGGAKAREAVGKRDREKDLHPLIHSPNTQVYAWRKAGTKSTVQVFPWVAWAQVRRAIICYFPSVHIGRKLGSEVELGLELRHADTGHGHAKWCLDRGNESLARF